MEVILKDNPMYSGVDNYYINREQPYEVTYAINHCLELEGVKKAPLKLRGILRILLLKMKHDQAGHCIRLKAYAELRCFIRKYKYFLWRALILFNQQ